MDESPHGRDWHHAHFTDEEIKDEFCSLEPGAWVPVLPASLAFELGDLQILEPWCTPLYNRDHNSIYLTRLSWQLNIAGVTHAC